ncbi:GlsB/YeaQ/YmgE family stress response membrane protein [Jatrophihabitans sp. YIM 134969]
MVTTVIVMIIVGLIAGAVARLLVPGTGGIGIVTTIIIGIVGSLVGGFIGYAIFHKDASEGAFQLSGLFGSIVGAIIVLLIYKAVTGRNGAAARR